MVTLIIRYSVSKDLFNFNFSYNFVFIQRHSVFPFDSLQGEALSAPEIAFCL